MKPSRTQSIAAVALVAAALGACTTSTEPTVATARSSGGSSAIQTSTGGSPASSAVHDLTGWIQAQRDWVSCLREHGLNVKDPDPTGEVDLMLGPGQDKADPKVSGALQACASRQLPRPASARATLTPEQVATFRAYARCMQQNGAPDFPDPSPDGSPPQRQPGVVLWDSSTPGARQAAVACASIIGDPATAGPGQG